MNAIKKIVSHGVLLMVVSMGLLGCQKNKTTKTITAKVSTPVKKKVAVCCESNIPSRFSVNKNEIVKLKIK